MNDQLNDPRTLLGAWALDAVDDRERALVERAIAADPELAEDARELRETVGLIATHDAQDPPAELRETVLTEVEQTEQSGPARGSKVAPAPGSAPAAAGRPRSGGRGRWLAAAAAAVIAVGVPTGIAIDQAGRADHAEQQTEALVEALTRPGAEMIGVDLDEGGRAVAVLAEDSAVFAANGMAELDDQDYQLWVVHDGEATSAGVLAWHDGRLDAQVEDFPQDAALAITAEPEGGSDQPTSDPLVVLARG